MIKDDGTVFRLERLDWPVTGNTGTGGKMGTMKLAVKLGLECQEDVGIGLHM